MANSPVFDRTCEEIEQRTSLERLEARGTVRLALKVAGLDAQGVDAQQMTAVLSQLLPKELASRGVDEAVRVCEAVAEAIRDVVVASGGDRAGAAAAALGRMGN